MKRKESGLSLGDHSHIHLSSQDPSLLGLQMLVILPFPGLPPAFTALVKGTTNPAPKRKVLSQMVPILFPFLTIPYIQSC